MNKDWTTLRQLTGSQLKSALKELWLKNYGTGYFLTLSFNRRLFFERGFGVVDKFFERILQGVHGQRWHKRILRLQNCEVYGFCEYDQSNVHFHLGVWGEKEELAYLRHHGAEVWANLQPQGDLSTERIKSVIATAEYSHKSVRDRDSQENLYTYLFPDNRRVDEAKNKQQPNKPRSRTRIWKNKQEKLLRLRGKVSLTKKNRGKIARYGGDET